MAKKVYVQRPHGLALDDAVAKLAALVGQLEQKYGVSITRSGATAKVSGRGVSGEARIDEKTVTVDLTLGLPASMIAGKIEAGVNKALDEHFKG